MKGLLIKDIKLLVNQKNFFIMLFCIAFIMMATSNNYSFIVMYITMVCSFFVLSSITYDEMDNGYTFLFTLPISKKRYVREKYVFGCLITFAAWVFSTIVSMIVQIITIPDTDVILWIFTCLGILGIGFIFISFMIPFELKFGNDKGRIAILCVVGLLLVFGILTGKAVQVMKIDLSGVLDLFTRLSTSGLISILVVVSLITMFVSLQISYHLIEKKEL